MMGTSWPSSVTMALSTPRPQNAAMSMFDGADADAVFIGDRSAEHVSNTFHVIGGHDQRFSSGTSRPYRLDADIDLCRVQCETLPSCRCEGRCRRAGDLTSEGGLESGGKKGFR